MPTFLTARPRAGPSTRRKSVHEYAPKLNMTAPNLRRDNAGVTAPGSETEIHFTAAV